MPLVKNNPEKPVPAEILAESIVKISRATDRMLSSGLNRRALILLVWDLVPNDVGKREVAAVLDALPQLEKAFLTKPKSKT